MDVIAGYTQLKKAGRIHKGLCPFHQEKTPSFTVDPAKQLYHCFGCGVGGDVFTLLRELEGLSFTEAAERLADRLGMQLRYEGVRDSSEGGGRRPLLAANRAAAEHFADLLSRSQEAQGARRYVEERGFSSEDARDWMLGYAPRGRDTAYRHLLGRKFTSRQIVDAGLALVTEGGEHRDRFRGRLVFPIADVSGEIVGFGARALGDEQPKYLNSPETPVYRKARILYGLDRAKAEMVRAGFAVVTEGYTDVMALHRAGVTNAVATCGTALGEEHFAMIKRFCDRVILAFDSDAAGAVASERGFGIHGRVGLEVLVAPIPAGKDPADVALTEGAEAIRIILGASVPLMRFVLEAEIARNRLDTPEGKGRALQAAAEKLRWEPNRVIRAQHAFWLAKRIGVAELALEQVMREIAEAREEGGRPGPATVRLPAYMNAEREALALLTDSPSLLREAATSLSEEHFTDPLHRVVFRGLVEAARQGTPATVMDRLPDDESRRLAAEIALTPIRTQEPQEVLARLELLKVERQIGDLKATLDRLDDGRESASFYAQWLELEGRKRVLKEQLGLGEQRPQA